MNDSWMYEDSNSMTGCGCGGGGGGSPPSVGGYDAKGCLPGAGYNYLKEADACCKCDCTDKKYDPSSNDPQMVGGGVDKHGCKPSTGYGYVGQYGKCCKCDCMAPHGKEKKDPCHSGSTGLQWDANKQMCCAPWNPKECYPVNTGHMAGGDKDKHGCKPSTGYHWIKDVNKCCKTICAEPHSGDM